MTDPKREPIESKRTVPARTLDFWFDYTCPFAYLASTQAEALAARMGVPLGFRPLLLGGVFRAIGTPQRLFETLGPAKAAHNAADMTRWAKLFSVELAMPAGHPLRSVEALRATIATKIDPAVVAGFYRAYWVEAQEISSREVISAVVSRAGHDPGRVLADIETPAIKDDLKRRTDEAVALGVFGVPTWIVDGAHLYWGQDRMTFVEGVRPPSPRSESAPNERTRPREVEVYWDFSSPFAYLGASQVDAFAKRTGAIVKWRPLLLGGLFRAIGTADVPLATFSPAKQAHVMQDLARWAEYWRVPFRFPSRFPMSTVKALRLWLALPEDRRRAFQDAVFRAYWADDRDIADDAVLGGIVGDEALYRDVLAKANSDAIKSELRASTEGAAKRSVFGVPTFIVDGTELYWGQDRLELLERTLAAG
ncbi:MAG TPA: 2-hydroxychromene-2-carboxylate isomerase [Labilithrix sp.]|nr:2-hydroxychromene-2-carboxylate isomerase [Labilithrix sp.]